MGSQNAIRLITRGDDLGAFRSVNQAILDAFRNGILRNTSIMVPAPYFQHAIDMVKEEKKLCLGLHITLTSEWAVPRWGPVSAPEKVPSLLDRDGCFFPTTMALFKNGANIDEMLIETQAQLHLARTRGLDIRYIDEHMILSWIYHPENGKRFSEKLSLFAEKENLIWSQDHIFRQVRGTTVEDIVQQLKQLESGTFLMITHPAYDSEEMRHVTNKESPPGVVAQSRLNDYRLLLHKKIAKVIEERSIQLVRYDEDLHRTALSVPPYPYI